MVIITKILSLLTWDNHFFLHQVFTIAPVNCRENWKEQYEVQVHGWSCVLSEARRRSVWLRGKYMWSSSFSSAWNLWVSWQLHTHADRMGGVCELYKLPNSVCVCARARCESEDAQLSVFLFLYCFVCTNNESEVCLCIYSMSEKTYWCL